MKSHSMKDVLNTSVNNIFLYLITECQKQYSGNFHVKWNIKFTNIGKPILKLKTHSGFHELFQF
jgi:hypothetical protein